MRKVLIIDDESSIRKFLRKLIEKGNYQVIEAENGNQGIEAYKKNRPDLIITDLIMPEKDGLETIEEIKILNPDVKIIGISGGGTLDPEIYLNLASKLGVDRTFAKPIDNDILLSTIKEMLSSR